MKAMWENPVWMRIWEELEADFRRRRADGRRTRTLIICELSLDTPDFELIPEEPEDIAP